MPICNDAPNCLVVDYRVVEEGIVGRFLLVGGDEAMKTSVLMDILNRENAIME